MKRNVLVALFVFMLIPAFVFATNSDRFTVAKAAPTTTNELVVPLTVENTKDLVAMDIPLGYSEGATLKRVEFTDRVADFEMKIAQIDEANHQVMIGLISMVSKEVKDLAPGEGPIANLVFELADGVDKVEIEAIETAEPSHKLTYYYNDYSSGAPVVQSIHPAMEKTEVSLDNGMKPTAFALLQNSPNPFNPVTKIDYSLPEATDVQISVFNILGQNVRTLVNDHVEAGNHQVVWDSKDNDGSAVASGIYFYRIKTDQFSDTKKMVLLK
jgi:hypothetical protein